MSKSSRRDPLRSRAHTGSGSHYTLVRGIKKMGGLDRIPPARWI